MNTKKLVKWILPLAALFATDQAFAYRQIVCGTLGTTPVYSIQDAGLSVYYTGITADPVTAQRYNAITAAFSIFNKNPSARTMTGSVYVSGATDATTGGTATATGGLTGNGKSEIFFAPPTMLYANGQPFVSPSALASTHIIRKPYSNGQCHITEADIVFNSTINWQTTNLRSTSFAYGGTNHDLTNVALHEIGHWFGLAHENRYYNVMGIADTHANSYVDSSLNEKLQAYLGEDASNGLVKIYGETTNLAKQDLSVTHWGRSGEIAANGQDPYSTHGRLGLYNSTGSALLPCVSTSGAACSGFSERFYRANKGQQIMTHFGFENNGLSAQTAQIRYYLSTDTAITSSDTLLLTTTLTNITRDTPDYRTAVVTLPANLTTNAKYYVGVIIDYDNKITELNETNNTAYSAILVN